MSASEEAKGAAEQFAAWFEGNAHGCAWKNSDIATLAEAFEAQRCAGAEEALEALNFLLDMFPSEMLLKTGVDRTGKFDDEIERADYLTACAQAKALARTVLAKHVADADAIEPHADERGEKPTTLATRLDALVASMPPVPDVKLTPEEVAAILDDERGETEEKCSRCDGSGRVLGSPYFGAGYVALECPDCSGTGKARKP